jgi:hypothetical protein
MEKRTCPMKMWLLDAVYNRNILLEVFDHRLHKPEIRLQFFEYITHPNMIIKITSDVSNSFIRSILSYLQNFVTSVFCCDIHHRWRA